MKTPRVTYSNVVATLALFIALGGASYAAVKLKKNSVGSKQIKDGQVKTNDLASNSVTGDKVEDGSLLPADFGEAPVRFAMVNGGNGNLNYGSGVESTSRTFEGVYRVTFNRSLSGCAAIATAGFGSPSSAGGTYQPGSTATVDMSGDNTVQVETTANAGGGRKDRSFHLAVFC